MVLFFSLLLIVGTASAGFYSRDLDGRRNLDDDITTEDPDVPDVTETPDNLSSNIVQSPLDDEDLSLVQQYFQEAKINKTGQLRYSSLATVEKALIKDLVTTIMKNEEYMLFLNKPEFPKIVKMVKSMLIEPAQDVLQQQIRNKVLGVQAYYEKVYKPLSDPEIKKESLEFLKHLKSASEAKNLTVEDTVNLKDKMEFLAFLLQDQEFKNEVEGLKKIFERDDVPKIEQIETSSQSVETLQPVFENTTLETTSEQSVPDSSPVDISAVPSSAPLVSSPPFEKAR